MWTFRAAPLNQLMNVAQEKRPNLSERLHRLCGLAKLNSIRLISLVCLFIISIRFNLLKIELICDPNWPKRNLIFDNWLNLSLLTHKSYVFNLSIFDVDLNVKSCSWSLKYKENQLPTLNKNFFTWTLCKNAWNVVFCMSWTSCENIWVLALLKSQLY